MESAKIHYKTQHFAVKTNKNCKCQVCAKYFENNTKLRRHIQKKHNSNGWVIEDVGPSKKLFKKCVSPSLKSNGSTNSTLQSTKKHFKEVDLKLDPFKCLFCEKFFANKRNLKRHESNIHKKEKDYICKFCGKAFAQKNNMKVHVDKSHPMLENNI